MAALQSAIAGAEEVSLGRVAASVEGRVHGLLLTILALPDSVPMIGFSLLLATPIALIALSLLVYGPHRPLPQRLLARRVPRYALDRAMHWGLPWMRRLEYVVHPRWPAVAAYARPFAAVALAAAVILALPMPGANWLAAVSIVLTGIGLLQRDGLVLLGATAMFALALTVLIVLATGIATALAEFVAVQ
jgi:hypothetical protein